MNAKCLIIFSGFNQRAVIAFLRTIEEYKIKYAIIACSDCDSIFASKYRSNIVYSRQSIALDLEDIRHSIKVVQGNIDADEYILVPTAEALCRFLLNNPDSFDQCNITMPLVHKDLYESISDKYSFGNICQDNGIKVPVEYVNIERSLLPLVAKPKKYFSDSGIIHKPVIIMNDKEKQIFIQDFDSTDFYYQAFVTGLSYYLLYYFHRNGEIFKFSQLNIIQQPGGKSVVAAVSANFHNSSESLKYERMFKLLKFHGLVMIEVRQNNNDHFMIEANPRLWGPSQLFIDAKVNLFEGFLHDWGFIDSIPKFEDVIIGHKYFWYGGIKQVLNVNQKLKFHKCAIGNPLDELAEWLEYDIYKRTDTIDIYNTEML